PAVTTTVSGTEAVGQTVITVADESGYFPGNYVQLGTLGTSDAEVRLIDYVDALGTPSDPPVATTIAGDEAAGQLIISVAAAAGLVGGDLLQLGTTPTKDTECRTIDSIDGNDITLTAATKFAHATGTPVVKCSAQAKHDLVITTATKFAHNASAVAKVTAPFTHTLTPADYASMPWASLERSIAAEIVERIIDVRIQSIELTGESGLPLKATVNYLAITSEKQASAQSATYETEMPFLFYGGTYTEDGSDVSALFRKFSLKLDNVYDADDQTDGYLRSDIPLIRRDVTGSWVYRMAAGTPYTAAHYDGSDDPNSSMSTGSLTIVQTYGTGTSARTITITIPRIVHTVKTVELDAGNNAAQEFMCEGHAEKLAGSEFYTVAIQNGVPSEYV
ncbi:MAG: hypothetical protein WC340_17670, partial [Kiritimatiellia bacterium]